MAALPKCKSVANSILLLTALHWHRMDSSIHLQIHMRSLHVIHNSYFSWLLKSGVFIALYFGIKSKLHEKQQVTSNKKKGIHVNCLKQQVSLFYFAWKVKVTSLQCSWTAKLAKRREKLCLLKPLLVSVYHYHQKYWNVLQVTFFEMKP